WGDHRIERFRLQPRGASFRATAEPVVTGGEDFRPVGIAVAPDGSLFVSDWVDKSYNLHGKGRLWHIRTADAPRGARPPSDPREERGPAADRLPGSGRRPARRPRRGRPVPPAGRPRGAEAISDRRSPGRPGGEGDASSAAGDPARAAGGRRRRDREEGAPLL